MKKYLQLAIALVCISQNALGMLRRTSVLPVVKSIHPSILNSSRLITIHSGPMRKDQIPTISASASNPVYAHCRVHAALLKQPTRTHSVESQADLIELWDRLLVFANELGYPTVITLFQNKPQDADEYPLTEIDVSSVRLSAFRSTIGFITHPVKIAGNTPTYDPSAQIIIVEILFADGTCKYFNLPKSQEVTFLTKPHPQYGTPISINFFYN